MPEISSVLSSFRSTKDSAYVTQIKHVLEVGRQRTASMVLNAEDKETCWGLVCEYRGLMNAITALKRLELECEEGLKNGSGSDTTQG